MIKERLYAAKRDNGEHVYLDVTLLSSSIEVLEWKCQKAEKNLPHYYEVNKRVGIVPCELRELEYDPMSGGLR